MHHKVATPPALLFRGGGALRGFLCQADWLRSVRLTVRVSASRAVRCTSTATIMVPGSRKWAKSYRQIRYISLALFFTSEVDTFAIISFHPASQWAQGPCPISVVTVPGATVRSALSRKLHSSKTRKGREKNEIVSYHLSHRYTKGRAPSNLTTAPSTTPPLLVRCMASRLLCGCETTQLCSMMAVSQRTDEWLTTPYRCLWQLSLSYRDQHNSYATNRHRMRR